MGQRQSRRGRPSPTRSPMTPPREHRMLRQFLAGFPAHLPRGSRPRTTASTNWAITVPAPSTSPRRPLHGEPPPPTRPGSPPTSPNGSASAPGPNPARIAACGVRRHPGAELPGPHRRRPPGPELLGPHRRRRSACPRPHRHHPRHPHPRHHRPPRRDHFARVSGLSAAAHFSSPRARVSRTTRARDAERCAGR